jgi:hypothetical protein
VALTPVAVAERPDYPGGVTEVLKLITDERNSFEVMHTCDADSDAGNRAE